MINGGHGMVTDWADNRIRRAGECDFDTVKLITQRTIKEIYPKYYPDGAVRFFLNHHCDERIREDIAGGNVYLFLAEGVAAGTVTLSENEIDRLFVLPGFQNMGYGRALLDFAEAMISKSFDVIVIHASLPAKRIYLKRGYKEVEYHIIDTGYGDFLCFDMMQKKREKEY